MITQERPKCDCAPLTNRGLDSQVAQNKSLSVKTDWIQGTFWFATAEELHQTLNLVRDYIDEPWIFYPGRGRKHGKQWSNSVEGLNGAIALYNLPDQENRQLGHCLLSFPARALNGIPIIDIWHMMRRLFTERSFKTTRFDIAMDDYSKQITFEMLDEATRKRNYTGFRKPPIVHYSYDKNGNVAGWTFSFGNRLCDRVLRIYDKATESGGDIDSVRIEAEFHRDLAQQVMADWIAIEPESFEEFSPIYLANVVVGSIKFIERTEDKNVSRMSTLSWWQQILDKVGEGIRHTVKAVRTTLEEKQEWITRQVSTTLAMFRKIIGIYEFDNYIQAELNRAESRFTDYHLAFIDHYKSA